MSVEMLLEKDFEYENGGPWGPLFTDSAEIRLDLNRAVQFTGRTAPEH